MQSALTDGYKTDVIPSGQIVGRQLKLAISKTQQQACKPHATLNGFLNNTSIHFLKLISSLLRGCNSENHARVVPFHVQDCNDIDSSEQMTATQLGWRLQHETNTQRTLPDEVGVGIGVAMSQVHNIVVMGEGERESQGVLRGSLPANHTTLVIADAASNPEPAHTL